MKDFKEEARILLNIICSRVSPCTHMTKVIDLRSRIVSCILFGIPLNVLDIILSEWSFYQTHGGMHLLFPSLITELYKKAEVEVYAEDTLV